MNLEMPGCCVAWPRKTLKLQNDRTLAEAITRRSGNPAGPEAFSAALRAHVDCELERERLMRAVEDAAREVLVLRHASVELEGRYQRLVQENASLAAERRRLLERRQELKKHR